MVKSGFSGTLARKVRSNFLNYLSPREESLRTAIFFFIFTTVFAIMNLFIYYRFIARLNVSPTFRQAGFALVIFLFASQIFYSVTFRFDFVPFPVHFILGTAIGFSFMLFVVSLSYEIVLLTLQLLPGANVPTHRIRLSIDFIFLIISVLYLGAGLIGGMRDPDVVVKDVTIDKKLSRDLTVVQLSDVHVGNVIRRSFVERLVERVNDQKPDLILITGDLVDASPESTAPHLEPMKQLRATYGVYFVTGNHEYFHGLRESMDIVKSLGIDALADESRQIVLDQASEQGAGESRGKAGNVLNLVGTLDRMGRNMGFGTPDLKKAFTGVDPRWPTVVMTHQPVLAKELVEYPADLILSGHTHGGQIFPFSLLVLLDQPYLSGLHRMDADTQIYVSNGTGFWGPPIRFMAPPEITVIRLHGKQEQSF